MHPLRTLVLLLVALAAVVAIGFALGLRTEDPDDRPAAQTIKVSPHAGEPAPRMDRTAFWQLMSETRAAADDDTGRQSELLERQVGDLPPAQGDEFQRIRHGLDQQAYSWDLWGAAYVIEDGCSDDCFRDFRAYLISLGRQPYETALRDPDSLASFVQDAEEGDWENADNPAPDDQSDLSGNPSGEHWDDEQAEGLVQRYPRLAARFR